MRADLHVPKGLRFYEEALEGLSRVNELIYRGTRVPSIYDAGVRYRRERNEAWRHVGEVVRDKWGDCEDLAAARVGELRASGEPGARVKVVRTGPRMTHAVVQRADGTIEDPSRKLGMGSERMAGTMSKHASLKTKLRAALKRAARKPVKKSTVQVSTVKALPAPAPETADSGQEDATETDWEYFEDGFEEDFQYEDPYPTPEAVEGDDYTLDENDAGDFEAVGADVSQSAELTWTVNRTPTGWQGVVRVPLDAGRMLLVARGGETKKDALKSAASAASQVLNSPLAKALIPPQAAMALQVIQSPQAQKAAKMALDVAKKLKFW